MGEVWDLKHPPPPDELTDLDDTPASYSGQANKYLRVNAGEDAIEFATVAGGGDFMADGSVPMTSDLNVDGSSVINHAQNIADNALLTVDHAAAASADYAKFTADGLEGRNYTEVKQDLSLEDSDINALITATKLNEFTAPDGTIEINNQNLDNVNTIDTQSIGSYTMIGDITLGEYDIKLDPALSADGKWSGITETGTAGTALVFGDCIHFTAASSRWDLAIASSATTSKGKLGMCVLAATAGAESTEVLRYGKIRADARFPNLPIGYPVFISAGTAGIISGTASAGTSDYVVRIVGHGNTANELAFTPDNTYIEIA